MRDAAMPEAGAVMLNAADLPWMEDETPMKTPLDAEKKKALARQDKIIAFFGIDEKSLVTPEEIVGLGSRGLRDLKRKRLTELRRMTLETEDPEVTAQQRAEFRQKLAQGEITRADEANFLMMIRDPLNNPRIGAEKMFERISADPRQVQILAVAAGYNLKNWQKVDQEALYRLLGAVQANGADYRTPVGFAKLKRYFLEGIRTKAKEQVYQCYVQSLKELERTLYGERFEYYRQFEELRKEAKTSAALAESEGEVSVRQTKAKRTTREKWTRILSERSGEMLGRAVIEGDAWQGEYLGTHDLAEAKLSPMYDVKVAEEKICLSKLFQLPDGQVGVIAYVPEGRSFKVRSFYRNNALGLWCYLPDYIVNKSGAVERYNMGWSQEGVILPFELQTALMQIENKFGVTEVARAEFIFAGTAQAYGSVQEYQGLLMQGKLRGDFYREVSREATNHDFGAGERRQKKAPYTLGIDYRRSPDFGQMRAKFVTNTLDAGATEVEGFSSHDGQLVWWFGNDSKGRTWVMHVEAVSPLTSLGLRRDWTAMGDFVTPLYEYSTKAGIYGDRDDTKGAKQCMWNNYLSNVPLIQDYVAQRD